MNTRIPRLVWTAALTAAAAVTLLRLAASSTGSPGPFEYATIRWDGRDNTHVIRPGGLVESIGPQLKAVTKPSRTDERSFYLNVAINGLVKEGWEVAAMTSDDILLRRAVSR